MSGISTCETEVREPGAVVLAVRDDHVARENLIRGASQIKLAPCWREFELRSRGCHRIYQDRDQSRRRRRGELWHLRDVHG